MSSTLGTTSASPVKSEFEGVDILTESQLKQQLRVVRKCFNMAIDGLIRVQRTLARLGIQSGQFSKFATPMKAAGSL